jgi:hypothetical protein
LVAKGHKATCWPIYVSSSSNAFAALRSAVSKPSVNQLKVGVSNARASLRRP